MPARAEARDEGRRRARRAVAARVALRAWTWWRWAGRRIRVG